MTGSGALPPHQVRSTDLSDQRLDDLDLQRLRKRPGAKWQVPAQDVLPAWVADMDYPVAPAITEALRSMIEEGDFGYPDWPDGATPVRNAFAARMAARYGWSPDPVRVREFTDVTQAVQLVIHLATAPRDGVVVHAPGFGPFVRSITSMGRRLVPIPMVEDASGWTFDLDRLSAALTRTRCSLMLLVNPHNPTGRVFTREELTALAELAARHNLLVLSDEIHADLTYLPNTHVPFASLGSEVEDRTVTLYSASKAFNLAGMRCAVGHIGSASLREALAAQPPALFGNLNVLGVRATLAAWTEGQDWLDQVVGYLDGNRRQVAAVVGERLPRVRHHLPEATYLSWLDCRELGWGDDPATTFREVGRVELSPGPGFGLGGNGFVRLNFATSADVLGQILERLVFTATMAGAKS